MATSAAGDFRVLYRELEDTLGSIARTASTSTMLEHMLETLLERFHAKLGFSGGRIYQRDGDDFHLCCGFGSSRDVRRGLTVPRDYPPHVHTLAEGLTLMRVDERGIDPEFEQAIGVRSTFAAIAVGDGPSHVIAFSIDGQVDDERVLYSLTAVRHVVNLKLEQLGVTRMLEESRLIQESMLPSGPPPFPGFDLDGRTRPADRVGGDLYDYLPLPDGRLGVAIADAAGHGVPAALLVRDVVTGLRVGTGVDRGVAEIVSRLNRVIHRAALSRKFVSLFYAEIDAGGGVTYCNAGHNPPVLWTPAENRTLKVGGPVLGPLPFARFDTGHAQLDPGDVLVLYTDGLVELDSPAGEPFGVGRILEVLAHADGRGASRIVDDLFAAADGHARGAVLRDDLTVMVVVRTPRDPGAAQS